MPKRSGSEVFSPELRELQRIKLSDTMMEDKELATMVESLVEKALETYKKARRYGTTTIRCSGKKQTSQAKTH